MNNQKVLIIDDEPQIRKLLKIVLESNDYKVLLADTGKEGLNMAANFLPDLILLDLGLPDFSGHQVLTELKTWFNKPVIILSVQNSENDIIKALDNGASDYLTKPFRTGELLARIRSSLNRVVNENPETKLVFNDLELDLVARSVKKDNKTIKLTSTEYNLLTLFATNEGKVLTHQFVLKKIWGTGYQSETQYLRVYIAQLRRKLEENPDKPKHFITESGVGYRFF